MILGGDDHVNELKEEKLKVQDTKRFLKWFRVNISSASTVIVFPPTMRKGLYTQPQIWQSFGQVKKKKRRRSIVIGGRCPIYRLI